MRRKRAHGVVLSTKAKQYGWMFSIGFILCFFGIAWILVAASMENDVSVIVGLMMIAVGLYCTIFGNIKYSKEYNKCISDTIYTTILWDEKNDKKYSIIQDGLGEILEVNYKPVQKVHQTTGRYVEKI